MTIRKLVSLTVSVLFFAVACSKQGQGERCDFRNGYNDCDDNLQCLPPQGAVTNCNPSDVNANEQQNCMPYRCCPPVGVAASDSRCSNYGTPSQTGTGGSDAGTDNTGGSESTGGTTSTSGT